MSNIHFVGIMPIANTVEPAWQFSSALMIPAMSYIVTDEAGRQSMKFCSVKGP